MDDQKNPPSNKPKLPSTPIFEESNSFTFQHQDRPAKKVKSSKSRHKRVLGSFKFKMVTGISTFVAITTFSLLQFESNKSSSIETNDQAELSLGSSQILDKAANNSKVEMKQEGANQGRSPAGQIEIDLAHQTSIDQDEDESLNEDELDELEDDSEDEIEETDEEPSTGAAKTSEKEDEINKKEIDEIEQDPMNGRPTTITEEEYKVVGSGLIYDCEGQQWACVAQATFNKCLALQKWGREKKEKTECSTVNWYNNNNECHSALQLKTNNSQEPPAACKEDPQQ